MLHLAGKNLKGLVRGAGLGDNNRLAPAHGRNSVLHGGAQSSFYLVADHGFTHFVGYRKSHPNGVCGGGVNQDDVRFGNPISLAVNVSERAVLIQSVGFIKQLLAERRGGKVFTALVAAVFEHAPAALRLHSLTEAVHFALLTFFGLISSFHNRSPIVRISPHNN